MKSELTIRHLGRVTRATVDGSHAQLKKFRDALLLKEFVLVSEKENQIILRRRAFLLHDDWPIRVVINRDGKHFEIDYCMAIPWGWIIGLTFFMLAILPFMGVPKPILAFVLALVVLVLAVYKQKFDCRPNATFWQENPRQRWGELIEKLLRDAFDPVVTSA